MNSNRTETEMADVNGTRLYYQASGTGRTLLFLHGFTLDHRMWNRQMAGLRDRYRVVTYDARGFGRSAMPGTEPYKHCDDAAALCEYIGAKRIIAIGHSIGAHQMLELSLSRPDMVAGFVSVGMAGLAGIPFSDDIMKLFGTVRREAREKDVDAAKQIWKSGGWFAPAREIPALAVELDQILADYSGWHWLHDNPAQNLAPPAAERLGDLLAPALIVSGGRDLPYNDAVRAALASGLKGATELRLPRASHMPNMEDPEAVNHAIDELARRIQ